MLGYHIPLLSLPPFPLNFNEQRFAHFKLCSDLCHQHVTIVTSKQILKATMWVEMVLPNTRSNCQISSSVKSHSNSLLSVSMNCRKKRFKIGKNLLYLKRKTCQLLKVCLKLKFLHLIGAKHKSAPHP